jgi:hypothetical protein
MIHRNELHYSYDISHLIEYAEISHPDGIIVDTSMSAVSPADLERLYKYQCHIIIRSDTAPLPTTDMS